MDRVMENGKISIKSDILSSLMIEDGDFIEQHVVKDGVIVLKKVEGDRLQIKISELLDRLKEELKQMKSHRPNNNLLSLLVSLEEEVKTYNREYSKLEYDAGIGSTPIMPEEKDMLILEIIYNGENSLSGISEKLDIPVSSVSELLQNLCSQGLVDFNKISDGKRGRPKHVYYLTMFGEQFCQENF